MANEIMVFAALAFVTLLHSSQAQQEYNLRNTTEVVVQQNDQAMASLPTCDSTYHRNEITLTINDEMTPRLNGVLANLSYPNYDTGNDTSLVQKGYSIGTRRYVSDSGKSCTETVIRVINLPDLALERIERIEVNVRVKNGSHPQRKIIIDKHFQFIFMSDADSTPKITSHPTPVTDTGPVTNVTTESSSQAPSPTIKTSSQQDAGSITATTFAVVFGALILVIIITAILAVIIVNKKHRSLSITPSVYTTSLNGVASSETTSVTTAIHMEKPKCKDAAVRPKHSECKDSAIQTQMEREASRETTSDTTVIHIEGPKHSGCKDVITQAEKMGSKHSGCKGVITQMEREASRESTSETTVIHMEGFT